MNKSCAIYFTVKLSIIQKYFSVHVFIIVLLINVTFHS